MKRRGYYVPSGEGKRFVESPFLRYDYKVHSNMLRRKEKVVMQYRDHGSLSIENRDGNAEWSASYIYLSSDRTATAFQSTTLIEYSVHVTLLNVSAKRTPWLIGNKPTPVDFLLVYCTQKQLEE